MSVTEQKCEAALAVIADGRTVTQVARDWDISTQTVRVRLQRPDHFRERFDHSF
jgi:transposase-like protein